MSHCQLVMNEILYFEKMNGRKPKLLILCGKDFREKFFSEIYEFTLKTDKVDVDFKNPGHFFGVPFEWKNITLYGGVSNWILVGG